MRFVVRYRRRYNTQRKGFFFSKTPGNPYARPLRLNRASHFWTVRR